MKKLVTLASNARVNALLCSSVAVLLTACGGNITDGTAQQAQTAAQTFTNATQASETTAAVTSPEGANLPAAPAAAEQTPSFELSGYATGELATGAANPDATPAAQADAGPMPTRLLASAVAVEAAATPEEQITQLYRTLLGRDPEPAGLAYWSEAMRNGLTIEALEAAIKSSDEYQQRNGGGDTTGGIPATTYNYYVAPTGSDSNPGTKAAPFKTIQRAAQVATRASTTVWVAPGTYTGGIKTTASGTASGRIYFVSTTRHGAKIVPPSSGIKQAWDNRGNYVSIIGFNVDGSGSGVKWTNGIYTGGSYGVIQSNRIQNVARTIACTSGGGSAIGVDSYYKGVMTDVIGNTVNDIGPAGCTYVQGIYVSTSGTIKNNVVYRVAAAAIHLWHDANNVTITNNTVTASRWGIVVGGGDFYHTSAGAVNVKVNSNLVYDNSYGISEMGKTGTNNTYYNNLVYKNSTNITLRNGLTAKNTVASEPLMVAYSRTAATPNFKLTSSSPAIGRGTATGAHPTDIDGKPRNATTGYDIGAYQH